jgi:ADP-ribosylation factor GTPase-activating protein 2/3
MELRGSSFSSWDDPADTYWKKEMNRDTETAVKGPGSSDRSELHTGAAVRSPGVPGKLW